MKTICIAGVSSGVGKTTVACFLIRHIPGCSALKMTVCHEGACPKDKPCNVCSSLGAPFKVITDPAQIGRPDTDTGRIEQAGAKRVVWGQTSPDYLDEAIDESLSHFGEDDMVVVEGNSFLSCRDADLAVMVMSNDENVEVKESAVNVLDKIDFVVVNEQWGGSSGGPPACHPSDDGPHVFSNESGLSAKTKPAALSIRVKHTFNLIPDGGCHSANDEFLKAVCQCVKLSTSQWE